MRGAIAAASALLVWLLLAVLALPRAGTTHPLVIPWVVPLTSGFLALIGCCVAFLAFGRWQVLREPTSFWVGIGFSAFAVGILFNLLAFPGLLPGGQPLLGHLPSTATWAALLGQFLLLSALLVAVPVGWPGERARLRSAATVALLWVLAVALGCLFLVAEERRLPVIFLASDRIAAWALLLDGGLALLALAGAVLSTRRYLRVGDRLLASMALTQITIIGVQVLSAALAQRYDLWWYLQRLLAVVAFLTMFFGLLSEYVGLYRRERDRTQQLQESEEQLRLATSAAEIGTWSWVPGTSHVSVSANWRGLFGVRAEVPVTFETWTEALHPEDRERAVAELRAAADEHREFDVEYRVVRPDGTVRWVADRGRAWYDAQGRAVGMAGVNVDITARRQAEEALQESERRLRLAQGIAGVGTFDLDLRTGVNTWTRELEAMYGLPPGGFPRTQPAWEGLVHPEDRAAAVALVEAAFASGEPVEGEWRAVWPDGSIHWLAGRFQVLRDASGRPLRMTGVNIDITARKQAEQERERLLAQVEAERERWQGVVEGIAEELWVADAEGRMTLLNLPAVTAMRLEEFAGKRIEEVLEEVEILAADGRVRPPEEAPLLRSLRGEIVRGEEVMRHRTTGTTRYRQFSSAPTRDASGTITGAVAIVRDITSQKLLAQEREHLLAEADRQRALLEGILRQLPAGVVVVSPSGQVLLTNAQAEELSGGAITPTAEAGRYPGLRGFGPDGRVLRREDWQSVRALASGELVPPEEMLLERPDGSCVTVLAGAAPVREGTGGIAAAVVVFYDITERKQAEAERERLHEELIRAERARADLAEQLTAEINHRMKNNLTLISGVLEVQALGLPHESLPWQALRSAIARLTALSAVHEQLYEARTARVDMRSVLQRIAEIDLQALFADHAALRVEGDPTAISSKLGSALALIGNELIVNALQHGAPRDNGELEVAVSVRRAAEGLWLRVWNSGRPVPADLEVGKQKGVGLALAHDVVVRQLKGSLVLRPEGEGTVAEVFVPEQGIREAELVPVGEGRPTPSV